VATKVDAAVGSPLIVDTADANAVLTGDMTITGIRWVGATTAAHTAILHNAAGVVVWAAIISAANLVHESLLPFRTNGLKVPTLGSGTLYIYRG